jgi:hypothetical protein
LAGSSVPTAIIQASEPNRPTGSKFSGRSAGVAKTHESEICDALSTAEHRTLIGLLERIAAEQQLTAGVHPGYRALRPSRARPSTRLR